jgi:iron complex transport system ATP-binding protein
MGPNGCGKTTLLDCVMALIKPAEGGIRLCGKLLDACRRPEIAQKIAYVPQLHNAAFPYTVREMVLMGRTAYAGAFSKPTPEDEKIALAALEQIGIAHFADKPYNRLSGGEIRLVLLARALAQKTPILLLDEPTAHLDFRNELLFLETVVNRCRAEGITAILATHSPDHAFFLASRGLNVRAAMMARGGIHDVGAPDAVITAENLRAVYGVKAKILTDTDEHGQPVRRVLLVETA